MTAMEYAAPIIIIIIIVTIMSMHFS